MVQSVIDQIKTNGLTWHEIICAFVVAFPESDNPTVPSHLVLCCITWLRYGNTIFGSVNGLSSGRRRTIISIKAGILLIEPVGTKFIETLLTIQTFSFKENVVCEMAFILSRLQIIDMNTIRFISVFITYQACWGSSHTEWYNTRFWLCTMRDNSGCEKSIFEIGIVVYNIFHNRCVWGSLKFVLLGLYLWFERLYFVYLFIPVEK